MQPVPAAPTAAEDGGLSTHVLHMTRLHAKRPLLVELRVINGPFEGGCRLQSGAGAWLACNTSKNSTSGWVIFWQNAPLVWGSRKQNCVALSSCEAEIIALSEAAKDMVYLRKFISGLTGKQPGGPSVLRTDNKAARDLSYNPELHNRTKHVARRHFFIRDMVEAFELNVPLVSTINNYADFFTKALKPGSFSSMRNKIMNVKSE